MEKNKPLTPTIQVVPEIVNSRTMVPLRFVAEKLGAEVVGSTKLSISSLFTAIQNSFVSIGQLRILGKFEHVEQQNATMMKNNKVFFDPQPVIEHFGAALRGTLQAEHSR